MSKNGMFCHAHISITKTKNHKKKYQKKYISMTARIIPPPHNTIACAGRRPNMIAIAISATSKIIMFIQKARHGSLACARRTGFPIRPIKQPHDGFFMLYRS